MDSLADNSLPQGNQKTTKGKGKCAFGCMYIHTDNPPKTSTTLEKVEKSRKPHFQTSQPGPLPTRQPKKTKSKLMPELCMTSRIFLQRTESPLLAIQPSKQGFISLQLFFFFFFLLVGSDKGTKMQRARLHTQTLRDVAMIIGRNAQSQDLCLPLTPAHHYSLRFVLSPQTKKEENAPVSY